MTYEGWTRVAEWPIASAAVVFLGVYSWLVIGQPAGTTLLVLDVILLILWAVFAVDYLMRLWLARPRGTWFVRNLPLLAMVALPFFRPLYLLRLITVLAVLRKATGAAFRGTVTVYVTVSALVIIIIGALGVLDAEQNVPGALITTFPDALWWALVTITTVGYGDLYPITGTGRIIASGLMIAGIALVGSVTATLASWFVERVKEADAHAEAEREAEEAADQGPTLAAGDIGEGGQQPR
jgi:voltage-gated potassium channel